KRIPGRSRGPIRCGSCRSRPRHLATRSFPTKVAHLRGFSPVPVSFLKPAKFFLGLSSLLVVASVILLIYPGPKFSIDFTGGTLMEINLPEGQTRYDLNMALRSFESEPAL